MKALSLVLVLGLALSRPLIADGTVTVQPTADTLATWHLAELYLNTSAAGPSVTIVLRWVTASGAEATLDPAIYPRTITLTGAEVVSICAAISPAGTDTFSGTAGAAKRFRQRVAKWLIDNGKLTRATNES